MQEIRLYTKNELYAKLADKLFLANKNFFYIGIVDTCVDPANKLFIVDSLIYGAICEK